MSRRRKAANKEFAPDPKFKSPLVTQFVNNIVRRGKKRLAERCFTMRSTLSASVRAGQDAMAFSRRRLTMSSRCSK